MNEDQLSKIIIGSAIEVHKTLVTRPLESTYHKCLCYELRKKGLFIQKEKPLPVIYKDIKLEQGYRIDILVENKVVIELKTVEHFTDLITAQTLTYLKHGDYKLGLFINFHAPLLKNGVKRFVM